MCAVKAENVADICFFCPPPSVSFWHLIFQQNMSNMQHPFSCARVYVCVYEQLRNTHTEPLISHKPGFSAHFSILHLLYRRKSFLTEDALKSIGIWLPRPSAFHNISTLLPFVCFQRCTNTWLVLVWIGMQFMPPRLNSPWPCVFRSPIQAGYCMSGCQPQSHGAGTDPENTSAADRDVSAGNTMLLTSLFCAWSFTFSPRSHRISFHLEVRHAATSSQANTRARLFNVFLGGGLTIVVLIWYGWRLTTDWL